MNSIPQEEQQQAHRMEDEDLKSLIVLFKTHSHLTKHVKLSLESCEISVNEFAAMEALYTKGNLTTGELIDLVLIPNSSMTYVLGTLQEKGYIIREKDALDKRIQRLTLTDKGRSLFKEIYEAHFKHMRSIFNILTEEEEMEMQRILKKLGKHAERQADETD